MTAPAALRRPAEAPAGPGFEAYDSEFEAVLGDDARLELVAETDAHEGPVYVPAEGALYFTTLPRTVSTPIPGTPRAVIKRLALDGPSSGLEESRRGQSMRGSAASTPRPGGRRSSSTAGAGCR